MKQQKYYIFLQKQILMMIGLSLIPGFVYVFFGWMFDIFAPALLWYVSLVFISLYGMYLYMEFSQNKMDEKELKKWYKHLTFFLYLIFSSWTVIFVINVGHSAYHLHYIAVFTQLGASVVASTLLVSDKKLFAPILLSLMLPLSIYFFFIGTWYGYILSSFSLVFLSVLFYASSNTNKLLERSYYDAHHDSLTGLYNRRYIVDYIDALHERLIISDEKAYLLLIDLDHFKTINDSLGHDIGDKLLQAVAKRLKKYSEESHIFARLGGDEFILVSKVLKNDNITNTEAYDFANRLLVLLREPYSIDHHRLHISASIGLHALTKESSTKGSFIEEVDIAMYAAKSKGRDTVMVFDEKLSLEIARHLEIEQKLYQVLSQDALAIHYQPQFDSNKHFIGCEALLRWTDDDLGVLSPDEFIPIAENTGLILELGLNVLRKSFMTLNVWNKKGFFIPYFSINISIRQLLQDAFIEEVLMLYTKYFSEIKENQTIVFEITEHVFSNDLDRAIVNMQRVKNVGVMFSIDDFGTGYSSLQYLQNLPVEEVKIDKLFITQMQKSKSSANIVSSIIAIAKNFNFTVVAEGVETQEDFMALKAYDCDKFQGHYFDKALSQGLFEDKYLST